MSTKLCEPGQHKWKDGAMQRYCDVCLDVQSYYAYSKQLEEELKTVRAGLRDALDWVRNYSRLSTQSIVDKYEALVERIEVLLGPPEKEEP